MLYDDDVLHEIDEQSDLLSYAEGMMEIKKRGKYYFAHCPLHEDLTPSLMLDKENNSYHCFSCGRSGRMIKFLMDFEGLKFDDAVKKASSISGVDMNNACRSDTMIMLKRLKLMHDQQKNKRVYEHAVLPESEYSKYKKGKVSEWLEEGIEQDILDLFEIRIDEIGNRILYPVRDIDGKLINIKGRTRYENYKSLGIAKYINYFEVGVVDYFQGLNITKEYATEQNELIIFESIKSVMKAYGWGYKNCAAAEKHTLTKEQISLLIKLRVNVVLAYDSDIDYQRKDVRRDIDLLKRATNVYIIEDKQGLLGGKEAKNSPADCGREIWEMLYSQKRKIV